MTLSGAARRRKGGKYRGAMAKYLRASGFPAAAPISDGMPDDFGDITGLGPWVNEAKCQNSYEFGDWSTQAEKAAISSGLYRWVLWVKRHGKPMPRDSYCVMPAWFAVEVLRCWADGVAAVPAVVEAHRHSEPSPLRTFHERTAP